MKEKIIWDKNIVIRHSAIEIAEHWLLAISGLLLLFSGLGELPIYKRYLVTEIPGLSWAGDFFINLKIHYLSAVIFISVILFHFFYHGLLGHRGLLPQKGDIRASIKTMLSFLGIGEEPKAGKYLAEQKLAYTYLGGVGMILVITGILKVIKNLPSVHFPPGFITWVTLIHTLATIFFLLGVLAHLAALLLKVNRPMVKPIFTGKMNLDYVRHRHALWYEELQKSIASIKETDPTPPSPSLAAEIEPIKEAAEEKIPTARPLEQEEKEKTPEPEKERSPKEFCQNNNSAKSEN